MRGESLVICPAHNEQDSVAGFYERLRACYPRDLLFVDDGSTDSTGDIIADIRDDRVAIITHESRRGYGAALMSGFGYALDKGYKRTVTLDADLQHNPEHISTFLAELDSCEVVLGSRYIRIDKYLEIPRPRLLINRYIANLLRVLFSTSFTDPFCGYRGYRDSFLKKIRLRDESYGLGLEILLEVIRTKTAFREVAVEALYPNPFRRFLDGLDDPRLRLLHYLSVIARKKREIEDEEKAAEAPSR